MKLIFVIQKFIVKKPLSNEVVKFVRKKVRSSHPFYHSRKKAVVEQFLSKLYLIGLWFFFIYKFCLFFCSDF